MLVYGAAHDKKRDKFLDELTSCCGNIKTPYVIGGDFNILRDSSDKNKPLHRSQHMDRFNNIIHSLSLREIHMGGGRFTWTNKQRHPTLEKLDRVLMSPDWEDLFPLVAVRKLVRDVSDHNPLLLSTNPIRKNPTR